MPQALARLREQAKRTRSLPPGLAEVQPAAARALQPVRDDRSRCNRGPGRCGNNDRSSTQGTGKDAGCSLCCWSARTRTAVDHRSRSALPRQKGSTGGLCWSWRRRYDPRTLVRQRYNAPRCGSRGSRFGSGWRRCGSFDNRCRRLWLRGNRSRSLSGGLFGNWSRRCGSCRDSRRASRGDNGHSRTRSGRGSNDRHCLRGRWRHGHNGLWLGHAGTCGGFGVLAFQDRPDCIAGLRDVAQVQRRLRTRLAGLRAGPRRRVLEVLLHPLGLVILDGTGVSLAADPYRLKRIENRAAFTSSSRARSLILTLLIRPFIASFLSRLASHTSLVRSGSRVSIRYYL